MSLILQPKISTDCNSIRVWVGATYKTSKPQLEWTIEPISTNNETLIQNPIEIKPLESARPDNLLNDLTESRIFTGIFEFKGCSPDSEYKIKVKDEYGASFETIIRTIPSKIPENRWFNILLVSCYHYYTDVGLQIGQIQNKIPLDLRPDVTFLMGDQVYLDLPTFKIFPGDIAGLAARFEQDYIRNWQGIINSYIPKTNLQLNGYAKLLSLAPSISLPDDHEFWNNFPNWSIFIGKSYNKVHRDNWEMCSKAMYSAFQIRNNNPVGSNDVFDIKPLSFFFADTRTNRDENKEYLLKTNEFDELQDWTSKVNGDNSIYPFFLSGQSIFANAASFIKGKIADYELPNYNDYGYIIDCLKTLNDQDKRVTCLTGDVHWGRIAALTKPNGKKPDFVEIISSPSSLVDSPIDKIGAFFKKIFTSDKWPKHDYPKDIKDLNVSSFSKYGKENFRRQEGNHVAILSFKRSGSGIENKVNYLPVTSESSTFNNFKKEIILPKLL